MAYNCGKKRLKFGLQGLQQQVIDIISILNQAPEETDGMSITQRIESLIRSLESAKQEIEALQTQALTAENQALKAQVTQLIRLVISLRSQLQEDDSAIPKGTNDGRVLKTSL